MASEARRPATAEFLELAAGRRGHFRLESGHHGALWLDLDGLFADARPVEPFVDALAAMIEPHRVAAVCGPLVGGAFVALQVARAVGATFCFTRRVLPPDSGKLFRARYVLAPAFEPHVRDRRVAIVDDVMSAGSALRGTYADLLSHGAEPVVAGALLVLGSTGADYFAEHRIPVEAVTRDSYDLWPPDACPLCADGVPLEDVAS